MSLTGWFRTYLYLPLGGHQVRYRRWIFNIAVVFLVSGLWHGAAWTFLIWGALHAIYYFIESGFRRLKEIVPGVFAPKLKALNIVRILITFHAVLVAWVFFRAGSLADAVLIIEKILTQPFSPLYMGASQLTTWLSICLIFVLIAVEFLQNRGYVSLYFSHGRFPLWVRWPGYIGMILGIAMLGVSSNAFIYFQF